MKSWSVAAGRLWAALADGKRHHVRDLATQVGGEISHLNGLWKQLPSGTQALLRQQDGWWQLKHGMAMVSDLDAQLVTEQTGFQLEVLPSTGSTNDVLWERWQHGGNIHKHVVLALEQTQGRGRLNRPWLNQVGQTLMFSVAWQVQRITPDLAALPLVVGWCIQQALLQQHIPAQLKWPNDLVIGSLKLGGVLVESKQRGERWHVVMGIGINVAPLADAGVREIATACVAHQAQFSSRDFLLQLLPLLERTLQQFSVQGFVSLQDAYERQMRDILRPVSLFERGAVLGEGVVLGVNEVGALRVRAANGQEQVYLNGEISLRPNHEASEKATTRPSTNSAPMAEPAAPAKLEPVTNSEPMTNKVSHPTAMATVPARYVLLDGGNSQLKWAWVDGARQLHFGGRAPYANLQAFADFMASVPDVPIVGCAVCGSKKMAAVEQATGRLQSGKQIQWLPSMRHALGVTNHYYKVQQHGSDRWFNVLGSRQFSHNSCVVVSCGTAITTDAITHDNHYLGGSIMPGFNLMKEAMAAKTANLNQPIGKPYPFATSTPNALASGMHDAACGAVVLMHHRLQQRQPDAPVDIILTGGGAGKIEQQLPRALILDSEVKIVDNLVLFGLLNWVEHTCNY